MKINGTVTTKSGRWSGVKNHTDRNYKNDKNEASINKKYTKFNRSGCESNVNKVLKKHYLPWLKRNNAHQRATGHSERQKTFKKFESGKKLTNLGIGTFGTQSDKFLNIKLIAKNYPNLSSGQVRRRYFHAVSWGLKRYMHHWNDRNPDVPVGHWETNVDENGAPHVHFEVVPLGYTRNGKGKPSPSMSNALKAQYHTKNRKEAFKKWNKQETNSLVQTVGTVLSKRFTKVPEFQSWELQHTGRKHSLSMETYKETQRHFDKERKRLDNQHDLIRNQVNESKHLTSELPELRSKHQLLTTDVNSLINHKSSLKNDIKTLNGQYEFSKKRQQKWSNLSVSEQNRLYNLKDSVSKLTTKKKNIQEWLNKRWLIFKRKHLKGYYKGLAVGLKYVFPSLGKHKLHRHSPSYYLEKYGTTDPFLIGAQGGFFKKKTGKHVSGMHLFIHGLTRKAGNYFNHVKNISKSFDGKDTGGFD